MTRVLRFALLVAFVLPAPPAVASTFTVTSIGDGPDVNPGNGVCAANGGQCTLRAALGEAAAVAGADTVTLPSGTYLIDPGLGQLVADSTVTINGAGARTTTLQGGAGRRVLQATGNLTLRGVTVTGGAPTSTGYIRGGGILVSAGDVTLERVAVRGNTIASETNAGGGGVAATGGSLEILDSTISQNTAVGRVGGSGGGSGTGGGVHAGAPVTIRRSTISGNLTQNIGAGQYSSGGGLLVASTVVLDHATVVGNTSSTIGDSSGFRQGGNVYVAGSSSLAIGGSVIAAGSASYGSNCFSYGTVTETARNITDNADCLGAGSLRNTDPKLGALVDNGGPTDTRRPAADSPALNAAVGCGARSADQRGNALPAGPACDLGAVEVGASRSVTLQASKAAAGAGEDITLVATITNAGADDATGETLTIELPAGATATTATSTLGTCTTGAAVTCSLGTLGRSAGATVVATVRTDGSALAITARRGGTLPDQSAADDAASVTVAGIAAPAAAPVPVPTGTTAPSAPGAGPAGDTAAPLVTGLKLGAKPTRRRGATLRFRVSEAATAKVVVQRLLPGRRSGARCAAKGRGKRCTRVLKVATRTVKVKAGAVRVKVPGTALKAGRLRFTVVATDAAGNASKAARVTGRVRTR